jgi:hypothetical protein
MARNRLYLFSISQVIGQLEAEFTERLGRKGGSFGEFFSFVLSVEIYNIPLKSPFGLRYESSHGVLHVTAVIRPGLRSTRDGPQ